MAAMLTDEVSLAPNLAINMESGFATRFCPRTVDKRVANPLSILGRRPGVRGALFARSGA